MIDRTTYPLPRYPDTLDTLSSSLSDARAHRHTSRLSLDLPRWNPFLRGRGAEVADGEERKRTSRERKRQD